MLRIRLLISLLCLTSFIACGYSFVLEGTQGEKKIALDPSKNQTHLREAGMILDSYLERSFSSMGLLSAKDPRHFLKCSIVSSSRERITSNSLKTTDRYRLIIQVLVQLSDISGKAVWQSTFTDQGAFSEGGQDEDALDEACRQISLQIARAVASLTL
jgi:hypothetical protein